jgi:hypothetical protein
MAKKDDHAPLPENSEFCGIRPNGACECGNNYRKIAEGKSNWNGSATGDWTTKVKFKFAQRRWFKDKDDPDKGCFKIFQVGWQAHHVVPCQAVKYFPDNLEDRDLLISHRDNTKWCINNDKNMIPMPIFGQTVKWYLMNAENDDLEPPPFVNIPQHDWEHNTKAGYNFEVKREVYRLWKAAGEKCEEARYEKVAKALGGKSDRWTNKLKHRGKREDGTHEAWKNATEGKCDKWYLPFSMADDGEAERRHFPFTSDKSKVWSKLKQLMKSLEKQSQPAG